MISSQGFLPFDIMAFLTFDIISIQPFLPFDIMSHSAFLTFNIISCQHFFPFDFMSYSAFFFTFVLMSFCCFVPFDVLSFRRCLPFNIFPVELLSHLTFLSVDVFVRRRFLLLSAFFTSTFFRWTIFSGWFLFSTAPVELFGWNFSHLATLIIASCRGRGGTAWTRNESPAKLF